MHSFVLLALGTSVLAGPIGNIFDVIYRRQAEPSGADCIFVTCTGPIIIGTGTAIPFPTGTAIPTVTGGVSAIPQGVAPTAGARLARGLSIHYNLAATTGAPGPSLAPAQYLALQKHKQRRQLGTGTLPVPSFSLFDPSAVPTPTSGIPFPTETDNPFPTETDFPFPTGTGLPFPIGTGLPFPTGEVPPFFPTTLATMTRGPQPTESSSFGIPEGPDGGDGPSWWEQLQEWLEGLQGPGGQNGQA